MPTYLSKDLLNIPKEPILRPVFQSGDLFVLNLRQHRIQYHISQHTGNNRSQQYTKLRLVQQIRIFSCKRKVGNK